MPQLSAASRIVSRACFLVPTNRIVPPRPASSPANSCALCSSRSVFCRSMMWIPPRSPWMKRRILGFQRRVWWPKWTPASSSSLMPISVAKESAPLWCVLAPPAASRDPGRLARAGPLRFLPTRVRQRSPERIVVPELKRGGLEAASLYISVPVWPSGDWLPYRYVERATQVNGWFGLAKLHFPRERMPKHQQRRVEELAVQAEPAAARGAPVGGVAADRVVDRRQVGPDLVGAASLEPDPQQGGARQAPDDLEVGDRGARHVRAGRHQRPSLPIAPQRRVDRAALGVGVAAHEGQVLAPHLAPLQLRLQRPVGGLGLGDHEQT